MDAIIYLFLRGLNEVLMDKYKWSIEEAESLSSFLTPMLQYDPVQRATAQDCIAHSWLSS